MTTLQPKLIKESYGTGTNSSLAPKVVLTTSTLNNVIKLDIQPGAIPLKNTQSLDDFIKELETEPVIAGSLAQSRKKLAATFCTEEAATLTSLRLLAGLSQDQLATRALTSQSHIAKIESGKNDPGSDVIERIADAIGSDPAEVFTAIRNQRKMSK